MAHIPTLLPMILVIFGILLHGAECMFLFDDCDVIPAPGCRCRLISGGPDVICSELNMPNVTELDIDSNVFIAHLDLSNNDFIELPALAFKEAKITSLDLSHTRHHLEINHRAFSGSNRLELKSLSLKATQQHAVPSALSVLTNLVKLDLSMNNIRSLRSKDFETLLDLEVLFLDGNPLDTIHRFVFFVNPRLSQLSLSSVDPHTFDYLLGASHAALTMKALTLSSFALDDLSYLRVFSNLNVLVLTDNGIDDGIIGTMPQSGAIHDIQTIMIEHNTLESFPSHLSQFRNLRVLSLNFNLIKEVTAGDLLGFDELTYLNLGDNRLEFILMETFLGLETLTHLDLSNNRIYSMQASGNISPFPDVTRLSMKLSGNRIECGEMSTWLTCLVGHQAATGEGPFSFYEVYNLKCETEYNTNSTLLRQYNADADAYESSC